MTQKIDKIFVTQVRDGKRVYMRGDGWTSNPQRATPYDPVAYFAYTLPSGSSWTTLTPDEKRLTRAE